MSKSPLARKLRRLRLHVICAERAIKGLSQENALSLDWQFLLRLKEKGRDATEDWWTQNGITRKGRSAPASLPTPVDGAAGALLPA